MLPPVRPRPKLRPEHAFPPWTHTWEPSDRNPQELSSLPSQFLACHPRLILANGKLHPLRSRVCAQTRKCRQGIRFHPELTLGCRHHDEAPTARALVFTLAVPRIPSKAPPSMASSTPCTPTCASRPLARPRHPFPPRTHTWVPTSRRGTDTAGSIQKEITSAQNTRTREHRIT